MERIEFQGKSLVKGYHTQEFRGYNSFLINPVLCDQEDAWIGSGYYFWVEEEFAHYWGEDHKMKTGGYDVYRASLDIGKCLNSVFNERHYFEYIRWVDLILEDLNDCLDFEGESPITLKRVNELLLEMFYNKFGITGVLYNDVPTNPHNKERKYSIIEYKDGRGKTCFFYYRKRIQIVMFELSHIYTFKIHERNVRHR